jgi:protein-L-isoaspartate O-methyltransferase
VGSPTAGHAAPLVRGDQVFVAGAYGKGAALLRVSAEKPQEIHFLKDLSILHGDMARWGDFIYASNSEIGNGTLRCLDWQTGKTAWAAPEAVSFCQLIAEDRLYLRYLDGTVALVEASPRAYVERGKFEPTVAKATYGTFTAPVIADQRLFIRDNNVLQCFDLRRRPRPLVPAAKPTGRAPPRESTLRQPDAVFVATPPDVVDRMLELARVTAEDIVYDLGSGDGRIVLAAAKEYKARGVGIELDTELVEKSRALVAREGLADRVTIRHADLFQQDLSKATVVTLYLLPHLNAKLLPQLDRLPKGARVVAHGSGIPGVAPREVVHFRSRADSLEHTLYLWVAPLR